MHLRNLLRQNTNCNRDTWTKQTNSKPVVYVVLGYICRQPYVGAPLSAAHRRRRLAWANQHQRFLARQWRNTLFTDEARVMIDFNDRRQRVFHRVRERFSYTCVKFGTASTMVWGGISYQGKTDLVFINGRGRGAAGRMDVNVNKDFLLSDMWTKFCGL